MQETIAITPLTFIFALLFSALFFSGIAINFVLLARRKELKASWGTRIEHLRARPWIWQDATVVLLVVCLAFSIATIILPFISDDINNDLTQNSIIVILIKTLIFHGPALFAIVMLLKIRGFSWKQAFGAKENRLKHNILIGVAFYIASIPILVVIGIVSAVILSLLNIPIDQQDIAAMFTSSTTPLWLKTYLIILAVIIAPIVEEVCFRGILLPLFIKNNKPIAAIFLVSLLFALIHFHIPSIAPLAGVAAAFSLAYIHTGSLITPIIMHSIFNSISITMLISIQHMAI